MARRYTDPPPPPPASGPCWTVVAGTGHPGVVTDTASTTSPSTAPSPAVAPGAVPSLRIGSLEVSPPVVLAPMAGITNTAFRQVCRSHGDGLFVSEMVTAR